MTDGVQGAAMHDWIEEVDEITCSVVFVALILFVCCPLISRRRFQQAPGLGLIIYMFTMSRLNNGAGGGGWNCGLLCNFRKEIRSVT